MTALDDLPSMPVVTTTPVRRTNRRALAVIAIVIVALGFVLFRGLGNATLFFRTASEAVDQMNSLKARRFRIQGIVVEGSVKSSAHGTDFVIEENGVDITVHHRGDPPELFQPNIPVVLEGRFAPGTSVTAPVYESDRMLVQHTNVYGNSNPARVKDYTAP